MLTGRYCRNYYPYSRLISAGLRHHSSLSRAAEFHRMTTDYSTSVAGIMTPAHRNHAQNQKPILLFSTLLAPVTLLLRLSTDSQNLHLTATLSFAPNHTPSMNLRNKRGCTRLDFTPFFRDRTLPMCPTVHSSTTRGARQRNTLQYNNPSTLSAIASPYILMSAMPLWRPRARVV